MATVSHLRPADFPVSRLPAVNVSQVPQRSPLRYPGGKTWLIPHIREWLRQVQPTVLVEPFAGGGIVALTAVMEELVARCIMIELDPQVAAFWQAVLQEGEALAQRIEQFTPTPENVAALERTTPTRLLEQGFRTLVLNRTRRAGILAAGAALMRTGENGQGLRSRWYPATLAARIRALQPYRDRIAFYAGDALQLLDPLLQAEPEPAALFVDPPYTAGGNRAGNRLYTCHTLDHERLYGWLAQQARPFLMTYDAAPEVVALVRQHGFHAVHVAMHNAHHDTLPELVITSQPLFA